MIRIPQGSDERFMVLALALPLVVRLYGDGMEAALQRLLLLALALCIAYGWAALFARGSGRPLGRTCAEIDVVVPAVRSNTLRSAPDRFGFAG